MVPLMRCRKCGAKTARRMCRCGSTELELMTVLNSPDSNTVKYESLVRLMAQAGLENIKPEPPEFHFPVRDMRVVGFKPLPSVVLARPQ